MFKMTYDMYSNMLSIFDSFLGQIVAKYLYSEKTNFEYHRPPKRGQNLLRSV